MSALALLVSLTAPVLLAPQQIGIAELAPDVDPAEIGRIMLGKEAA